MQRYYNIQRFLNPWTLGVLAVLAFLAIQNGALSDPGQWAMDMALTLPGIIVGLSFHEFSHAYVAWKLGDDTPKLQGRVTLNPAAHIDPIGLLALIFIRFGWGRPVEVYPGNFKNRRRDSILVSLAGVTMNLMLAILVTLGLRLFVSLAPAGFILSGMGNSVFMMFYYIILINLALMVFNLLPVPPLDGFNIITEIFNLRRSSFYYKIQDKGFLILMVLIVFNITDLVLFPVLSYLMGMADKVIFGG